jgi:hypothetical protein
MGDSCIPNGVGEKHTKGLSLNIKIKVQQEDICVKGKRGCYSLTCVGVIK